MYSDADFDRVKKEMLDTANKIIETLLPAITQAVEIFTEQIKKSLPIYVEFAEKALVSTCPNRRVAHLAKHARKERTRKKNVHRITKKMQRRN